MCHGTQSITIRLQSSIGSHSHWTTETEDWAIEHSRSGKSSGQQCSYLLASQFISSLHQIWKSTRQWMRGDGNGDGQTIQNIIRSEQPTLIILVGRTGSDSDSRKSTCLNWMYLQTQRDRLTPKRLVTFAYRWPEVLEGISLAMRFFGGFTWTNGGAWRGRINKDRAEFNYSKGVSGHSLYGWSELGNWRKLSDSGFI